LSNQQKSHLDSILSLFFQSNAHQTGSKHIQNATNTELHTINAESSGESGKEGEKTRRRDAKELQTKDEIGRSVESQGFVD
jgi:uncharacterized protein YdaU (DUF1376 family)